MENHWQEIWNKRKLDEEEIAGNDRQRIILELKRLAGWDFHGKQNSVMYSEFEKEYEYIKRNLQLPPGGSVFEVGCGSGANLYFFCNDGYQVGGSDYAENLLAVAERVIGAENLLECLSGEADVLPIDRKYDAVMSAAVFVYFTGFDYATRVLDRMLEKTKKSLGILRVLNAEKEADYLEYRRAHVKNYDELYKGLPKLFFPKDFFREYAARHRLRIKFDRHHMEGFWNEPFNFDCFMYR